MGFLDCGTLISVILTSPGARMRGKQIMLSVLGHHYKQKPFQGQTMVHCIVIAFTAECIIGRDVLFR